MQWCLKTSRLRWLPLMLFQRSDISSARKLKQYTPPSTLDLYRVGLHLLWQRVPGLRPAGSADEPRRPLFEAEGWEGEADVSDWEPFRLLGRSMVDYIADYYQGVESLPVRAIVEPGYLKVCPLLQGWKPFGLLVWVWTKRGVHSQGTT